MNNGQAWRDLFLMVIRNGTKDKIEHNNRNVQGSQVSLINNKQIIRSFGLLFVI